MVIIEGEFLKPLTCIMNKKIEVLDADISRNRRLSARRTYVVTTEVHVKEHATLTIENGTTILIKNGLVADSKLRRAALIFDQGSALRARRVYIKACANDFKQCKEADNAGVWFLGNFQPASKDTISVKPQRKAMRSSFKADLLATYYLGRRDPTVHRSRARAVQDDIDGLSILGVGPAEWSVSEVRSFYSADDGIDLTNSHIRLDRLKIQTPVEDGINLSSSQLEIHQSLKLKVKKTAIPDRDLVDFETDDGPSFLVLHARCKLDLNGVFGDQVALISDDMPVPDTSTDNETRYKFKGKLKRPALIYSIDQD